MGKVILKYRNLFLMGVLIVTLMVSCYVNQDRLNQAQATVALPVAPVSQAAESPLEAARRSRDETALTDMAALQALVDAQTLDATLREDAAARLTALVDAREKQEALENALAASGVAPCVAVLAPGCVTIATGRTSLTAREQALVLTLAKVHAGVEPSGVRILCAEE